MIDHKARVLGALAQGGAYPSTDYDLNPSRPMSQTLRPAAILLALVDRRQGPNFLLTKRAEALKHHPGQVSFPGGKVEGTDADHQSAALREAQEEIGLSPGSVEILGRLSNHETVTGFDIQPFVAWVAPDFSPQRETGEVDEVFEVPLAYLSNPGNYRIESRIWAGSMRYYYVAPYGPYYIWGATARVLKQFADQMARHEN